MTNKFSKYSDQELRDVAELVKTGLYPLLLSMLSDEQEHLKEIYFSLPAVTKRDMLNAAVIRGEVAGIGKFISLGDDIQRELAAREISPTL